MSGKLIHIGVIVFWSIILCSAGWALDYDNMTNAELAELQGAIRNAPEAEQKAFELEWTKRRQTMTDEEKKEYGKWAEDGPGSERNFKDPYAPGRGYDNQGAGSVIFGGAGNTGGKR